MISASVGIMTEKLRVGIIGVGKMGLSHCAIVRAHPLVDLVGVCDSAGYVLDVLEKYGGIRGYSDYRKLIEEAAPECVIVATPSRSHGEIVRAALDRGIHVFCEKPFSLDPVDGRDLARLAEQKGVVNQVGYHYRFVGAFQEARRVVETGLLGRIHHTRVSAYGPVVVRVRGSTWRTRATEGGGCLYDYACHAIDLVNFLVGPPEAVSGVVLNKVFSRDTEDEVYATLHFPGGGTGQLAANWSDDSIRKMSTQVMLWGTAGKLVADRQECQIYLRDEPPAGLGLRRGWNVRYTTDVTEPVWFYLRGEEYSAQIDYFMRCVHEHRKENLNSFSSAVAADEVVQMILQSSRNPATSAGNPAGGGVSPQGLIGRLLGRSVAR